MYSPVHLASLHKMTDWLLKHDGEGNMVLQSQAGRQQLGCGWGFHLYRLHEATLDMLSAMLSDSRNTLPTNTLHECTGPSTGLGFFSKFMRTFGVHFHSVLLWVTWAPRRSLRAFGLDAERCFLVEQLAEGSVVEWGAPCR